MRAAILVLVGSVLAACVSAGPSAGTARSSIPKSARIALAMQRLGASPERSDCYAARIANDLAPSDAEEAAELVEKAHDREDMKNGVLDASERVKRAFIGASLRCSSGL